MSKARTFEGTARGRVFSVTTKLTDETAIKRLQKVGDKFHTDCAKAIHNMTGGFDFNPNLVAWGFRLAEENAIQKTITLAPTILARVAPRKPLTLEAGDNTVKVSVCGDRSQYTGQYNLTNGEPFGDPKARFYGRATPDGKITITAPKAVVDLLEKGE